jgi:hypothetical protein
MGLYGDVILGNGGCSDDAIDGVTKVNSDFGVEQADTGGVVVGAVGLVIKELGAFADVLGPQLGLKEETINQIDAGISGAAAAADNQNVLVAVAAGALAGLAVAAVAPEALAAGRWLSWAKRP